MFNLLLVSMKQVFALYPDREKDLVNDKTSVPILAINYRRNNFFFKNLFQISHLEETHWKSD